MAGQDGLKMVVGIKWVPNTQAVRFDPKTGTLIREGVPSVVNPHDLHAVELALKVKERFGGKIVALSMAPPAAVKGLEHVIGMGVDEAVLVSDRVFAGADTLATSYVLAKAIERIGGVDIVFFGQETIDSSTAHIPAQVASWLDWTYVYYVEEVEKIDASSRTMIVRRKLEDRREWYEVELPAVIGVAMHSNPPRPVSLANKLRTRLEKPIQVWSNDYMQLDRRCIGLQGSPTIVTKVTWMPEVPRKRQVFKGDPKEAVKWLISRLEEEGVLPF
ncbi:MAG: electron transfer flavoprotein subunit beta/FixA family protein [Thermoproteota archaeon]